MTNGDKLRRMTDEELAEMLQLNDCENCPEYYHNCGARMCRQAFLAWLKQEAPSDGIDWGGQE